MKMMLEWILINIFEQILMLYAYFQTIQIALTNAWHIMISQNLILNLIWQSRDNMIYLSFPLKLSHKSSYSMTIISNVIVKGKTCIWIAFGGSTY